MHDPLRPVKTVKTWGLYALETSAHPRGALWFWPSYLSGCFWNILLKSYNFPTRKSVNIQNTVKLFQSRDLLFLILLLPTCYMCWNTAYRSTCCLSTHKGRGEAAPSRLMEVCLNCRSLGTQCTPLTCTSSVSGKKWFVGAVIAFGNAIAGNIIER